MAGRVDIGAIRELMRHYMDEDSQKRSVITEGSSLDEALKSASVQLDCPILRLEYDVIEKGSDGFIGFAKKNWKINAYETISKKKLETVIIDEFETNIDVATEQKEIIRDADGKAFVRLSSDGAMLKVIAPVGKGKKVTEKHAIERLQARAVHQFNEDLVRSAVRESVGEWVIVGTFITNPAADALLSVDVGTQEMEASITLTPPGPGGCDISKNVMLAWLRNNKVIYGIMDNVLQDLENEPKYREPVIVAKGKKPIHGSDASIEFLFETDRSKLNIEEKNGRVDYKELNLIQNIVEGQILARKTQATRGEAGQTITGKLLSAKDGKDVPLPLGKNVHASEDGLEIIADVKGEATYIANKVNVETVYTIAGNVDYKTGNQTFLGTIIILGNIEDGFSVNATGNIEIRGNVGKSDVTAEGDIIVHQGITGKGGGSVIAGKNVWAKFIENAKVESGNNVIVTTSIINSDVISEKRIICSGQKQAAIIGGRCRACEEINAKTVGTATGGADTVLEVGTDPKSRVKLDTIDTKMKALQKQIEEYDKNISTLNEIKRQRKSLSDDREALLQEMVGKHGELTYEMQELKSEYDSITAYINSLKITGKISVSGRIYPGTEIIIRGIKEKLKAEYRAITFYLENMMIKTTKYEEFDAELLKRGRG